jgi:hypothetical protein
MSSTTVPCHHHLDNWISTDEQRRLKLSGVSPQMKPNPDNMTIDFMFTLTVHTFGFT